MVSDNATHFTLGEFQDFCQSYRFVHTTTSPHFTPGQMVLWSELCTLLILKQPDPYLALMCYKATPSAAMGVSPALLMAVKHMLEDKLQATPVDRHQIQQKDAQTKSAYQFFHALPELQSGQAVRVKLDGEKGWKISTKVIGKYNEPWFYIVKTDNSAVL